MARQPVRGRDAQRRATVVILTGCLSSLFILASGVTAADSRLGATTHGGVGTPSNPAWPLVLAYDQYLKVGDLAAFRRDIDARYPEATLVVLSGSEDAEARRAAVMALGVSGSFASNAAVGRRLKDRDPIVRGLAVRSLWAIWRRGETPEQDARLREVRALIDRDQLDEAIRGATRLIATAPTFAEAYNARAMAYFSAGRLAEAAADCRRVVELNPYHFGALDGLARCQLGLEQRAEAIRTLRRSLELQPYSDDLRATIAELEAVARD